MTVTNFESSDLSIDPPGGRTVRTRLLGSGGSKLPLVIEPQADGDRTVPTLAQWLGDHHEWVERVLTSHGAILFRGFAVHGPVGFESVARAIAPDLKNDYLGTSPRDGLTDYVFSASELPPYYPIPQHCEMSFTVAPPRRIFFSCLIASRGEGGETPFVDFRRVARDLDPDVRDRFERKGVRNIRNYCGPEGGSRFDLWKLKRWDEMFRTTDRDVVERICRENEFEVTWKSGGRLQLTNVQPAFKAHPVTGEAVWFNHSQVFHLSSVPDEYRRIAQRQGRVRYGALARVAQAAVFFKARMTATEDQAMQCTFGDGSPIDDRDMDRVRDAIWNNMVFSRWRAGDIVALDNFSVSHGRMPYSGPRKVAVCWA